VLRKGKWAAASPSWATSKLFIDLRGDPYREANYQRLLDTLFGKSPTAPPVKSDLRIESTDSVELIEKISDEKQPPEPKIEKPKTETSKPSTQKIGVGGDVSDSVIVTGSNNVINVGTQETPSPKPEKEKVAKPVAKKEQPKKAKPPAKPNTAITVALIGLVGTIGAALVSSPMLAKFFERTPEPTAIVFTPTVTKTPAPSKTPTKVVTFTPAFTPTATPYPTEITDEKGITMRLVPAGAFTMGSDDSPFSEDKPAHSVYLDNFYLDTFEVTNFLYQKCVDANICSPALSGYSPEDPVIGVNWEMAKTYCEAWRSGYLPSEAKWEKAALGTTGWAYPWGDRGEISCDYANYFAGYMWHFRSSGSWWSEDNYCVGHPVTVGSYEKGKSIYGVYDMAGNVSEWTDSFFSVYSSEPSDDINSTTNIIIVRGGSWASSSDQITSYHRFQASADTISDRIGFRCARGTSP